MANYANLKSAIQEVIKTNGNNEITGALLQQSLIAMINSLGANYQFAGVATPTTVPGTPDQKVFYFAGPGTYPNFNGAVIPACNVGLMSYNGTWHVSTVQTTPFSAETIVNDIIQLYDGSTPVYPRTRAEAVFFDNDTSKTLDQQLSQLGQEVDAKTVGTTDELITPEINQNYIIRAGDGSVASANNFAYTAKFSASKGQVIFVQARGYLQNIAIISKVITEGSSYTPVVKSIDSTIREYTYYVKEDGYYAVCFNYNYPWHIELVSNAPADLVSRIQQNEAYKKYFIGNGNTLANSPYIYNLKPGNKYRITIKKTPWDMTGVTSTGVSKFLISSHYNGASTYLVYVDMSQTPAGYYDITIPENSDYIRIAGRGANGTIVYFDVSEIFELADGTVTTQKIADGAVTKQKLASDVLDSMLDTVRSNNLYDARLIRDGYFVSNNGNINPASGWAVTPFIPVVAGRKYTISNKTSARNNGISWFNANKVLVEGGGGSIYGTHTAPENAAFVVFNVAANNSYSTGVMINEGETELPYEPYVQITTEQIKNFANDVLAIVGQVGGGALSVTKNGNTIVVTDGSNTISGLLNNNSENIYGGNPVFNFNSFVYNGNVRTNPDDIAPLHAINTTIGANHGQPCVIATITGHGLDNTAIGTGWTKDGHTFYVMRIVDANRILFLSENSGSLSSPLFVALTTGTLTRNGVTMTVSAVSSAQLYPALKNHNLRLVLDGKEEITQDGAFVCDSFDIVETYEIMNPASTLTKIIARAGQSGDPVFDGDPFARIETVYKFTKTMTIVVIENVVPIQQFAFSNAMFTQAARIGNNGTAKYYVPNSLPVGGGAYDMRKPLAMTWGESVPTINIGRNQMKDPDNNPVNRVIQYDATVGLALGFLTDRGVGQSLLDYTNTVFELRNDTGKVYPHGVDTKVGSTLSPGQIYTAVMYRSLFVPETSGNRISMYHFGLNGNEYVFVDYSGSMLDKVVVDDSLNGKKIEILEAVNAELKTNIYDGGFYVNATYVNNETCYMIAKIS